MSKIQRKISLSSPSMQMGKSTIANYLVEKYNFKRLILAKTLKDMGIVLLKSLNISEERTKYYTETAKEEIIPELGVSWRWICQSLGTEWGRRLINPDIWLKTTEVQMLGGENFICDDTRFLNEANFYKELGFIMVKVVKPDVPIVRNHASEGELDDFEFDYTIVNNGTIEDLHNKIDKLLQELETI